jgi:hypothetical protein
MEIGQDIVRLYVNDGNASVTAEFLEDFKQIARKYGYRTFGWRQSPNDTQYLEATKGRSK